MTNLIWRDKMESCLPTASHTNNLLLIGTNKVDLALLIYCYYFNRRRRRIAAAEWFVVVPQARPHAGARTVDASTTTCNTNCNQ